MWEQLVATAVVLFFSRVLLAILLHPSMFLRRFARTHRLIGLLLLLLLLTGFAHLFTGAPRTLGLLYDASLSIVGIAVTLSAAYDFGPSHARVKNNASGTLDEAATVTQSEMIEHSFYQALNLCQILYLHAVAHASPLNRLGLLCACTAPWCVRRAFPVNHFSDNYNQPAKGGATPLIRVLYRLKKWQYLLYKHFLLHGLNLSVVRHHTRHRTRHRTRHLSARGRVLQPNRIHPA